MTAGPASAAAARILARLEAGEEVRRDEIPAHARADLLRHGLAVFTPDGRAVLCRPRPDELAAERRRRAVYRRALGDTTDALEELAVAKFWEREIAS